MSVGNSIYKLRAKLGLSQEQFAGLFGVSRQSMQKWENGTFKPDLDKLIAISKYFNVSLDALVFDRENEDFGARIPVAFANHGLEQRYGELYGLRPYFDDLEQEYEQCEAEGIDLSQYKEVFRAVAGMPQSAVKNQMADLLFRVTMTAPRRPGYKYSEPSGQGEIRALTRRHSFAKSVPDEEVLRDKIYGAWLGRCCGAYAGYVVEGMQRDELSTLLRVSGNYPMRRYILSTDFTQEMHEKFRFKPSPERFVDRIERIDCTDVSHTVLAGCIIEKMGREFTPTDVASYWLSSQPRDAYRGDARIIMRNLICGYYPPDSAVYENPYRESAGAWARADYYGYINPGDPEAAAGMAWRDASVSHVKNGIYGSMYAAAMLAAAAATENMRDIVLAGRAQIPTSSRLYECVSGVIDFYDRGGGEENFYNSLHRRFCDSGSSNEWAGILPNAGIVTAALLYGEGNFGRSVCSAVQAAFDAGCNAAIVGSILGMRGGVGCIAPEWREPVGEIIETGSLMGRVRTSELVARTMRHIRPSKAGEE